MLPDRLGDHIGKALGIMGITPTRVSQWLGRPCRCKERQKRLNALGRWANRVIKGKTDKAEEYLDRITEQ